jgi:hypothetical protein
MLSPHTKKASSQLLLAKSKAKPTPPKIAPKEANDLLQPGDVVTTPLQLIVAVGSRMRNTPETNRSVPTSANMEPMRRIMCL